MNDTEQATPHPSRRSTLEEFLKPMGLSQNQLALAIRDAGTAHQRDRTGQAGVTADTALRLARYFAVSPNSGLGCWMDYDLDVAEDEIGAR